MSSHEIIVEIQKLPLEEQRRILNDLTLSLGDIHTESHQTLSEDEVEKMLVEQGILGPIQLNSDYSDEDEDFDPIEVQGKPLSETIIEERR